MFREVINRRRMLLTLTGIGSAALLWRMLSQRDVAETPNDESTNKFTAAPVVKLEVTCVENQLAFAPTELVARANSEIHLTFHNVSTVFMHNWVLVEQGEAAVDQVIQDGTAAGPSQSYLPADMSNVIAYTELVESGASATITFAAPPVGEYTYLCTFPGHCLAGMRGTLIISAQGVSG